ncbi:MAG: hypothetical protein ACYTEU_03900 [Planctomycetota bacterium]|jgi:uncharacterized membrane protein
MESNDHCSGCGQKDTCRQAYEKLGKATGPNVACKVIVAFLVPIAVFIGVLAGSQWLLQGKFEENMLILVSFILALCVTLLVVFVIRAVSSPKKKEHCDKR